MEKLQITLKSENENNSSRVFHLLVDPEGNEYELRYEDSHFVLTNTECRNITMGLNLMNLARFCRQHELQYKSCVNGEENIPMFNSLDKIYQELKDNRIVRSRVVHIEDSFEYNYIAGRFFEAPSSGIESMPEGMYFVEPIICQPLISECNWELMAERVIWLRNEILQLDINEFALKINVPANLYAQFEQDRIHLPLVLQGVLHTFSWLNEDWVIGK